MNGPALTELDITLRLALSFIAGGIVGFERTSRHQVAGLRTHILICVGSTLLMLLSLWIPEQFLGLKSGDPGRIAAQVVSGIGFLGAGAIMRLGNNVKGLTTAASLWLIAAVGLALGAGFYLAAGLTLAISLFTLVILDRLERRFFPTERIKILELEFKDQNPDITFIIKTLADHGVHVQSIDIEQNLIKGGGSRLRLLVSLPSSVEIQKLSRTLKTLDELERIEIKEKY
ncbi:MgtC/SapB family protein [Treponema sp. J25]|uniref:MgtC/SapB family protein n=1 Tax=Treponema sp. J25 TaxID=2094121 RepID=UPI0010534F0F|nr:MgtC/SapB family protein [Treponema sp. J25]TCW60601.1 magnesium transporter MgtC [Treponema sp. J25]